MRNIYKTAMILLGLAAGFIGFTNKTDAVYIPVLTYHNIEPYPPLERITYSINNDRFEKHMRKLKEKGYQSMSFSEYGRTLDEAEKTAEHSEKQKYRVSEEKRILITADDGKENNYVYMNPVMKKYGMKANLFIIGHKLVGRKDPEYMDEAQLKELLSTGLYELGAHTFNLHYKVNEKPVLLQKDGESIQDYNNRLKKDLNKSKEILEHKFGKPVTAFAYPYGVYSEEAEELLKKCGIRDAFTTVNGITAADDKDMRLIQDRINVDGFCSAERLIIEIEFFKRWAVFKHKTGLDRLIK